MRYCISDIHGNSKTFLALLDQIAFSTNDELYLLGDYVDRGPDSKGVFDQIFKMQKQGYSLHCLAGNHEEMMLDGKFKDARALNHWLINGGKETLKSFSPNKLHTIPEKYWDFIDQLPTMFEVDNYILVHAGLNFDYENPFEDEISHMWARRWYHAINYDWLDGRIIIHGHTTQTKAHIEHMLNNIEQLQYLDIDNGCYRYSTPDMGQLCAFDLDNRTLHFQKNVDVGNEQ